MSTELDWVKKKTEGYAIQVFGLIISAFIIIVGWSSLIQSGTGEGFAASLVIAFIVGSGIIWYGNQLVEKAKHVAWTKEALREYEGSRELESPDVSYKSETVIAGKKPDSSLTKLNFDKESTLRMLDDIDKSLVQGNISESMYKDLKAKYELRIKQIEQKSARALPKV